MVQSWFSITSLSIQNKNIFPWDEQGTLNEEAPQIIINRQHTVIALTTWEHLDPRPSWLLLILSTRDHITDWKFGRPKSTNGSCEYFERLASEIGYAISDMQQVSDAVWDVVSLPVCSPIFFTKFPLLCDTYSHEAAYCCQPSEGAMLIAWVPREISCSIQMPENVSFSRLPSSPTYGNTSGHYRL